MFSRTRRVLAHGQAAQNPNLTQAKNLKIMSSTFTLSLFDVLLAVAAVPSLSEERETWTAISLPFTKRREDGNALVGIAASISRVFPARTS
jgi:hypothetical protein